MFEKSQKEFKDMFQLKIDEFDSNHFKSLEKATKAVNDYLYAYKNKNKYAYVVAVHSTLEIKRLIEMGVTILNNDVPYCRSYAKAEETQYPALEWTQYALSYFTQTCISLDQWMDEKYGFSMHSKIPIGNFGRDAESMIIDVLFSRALQSSNCLLWYSDTSLPDLGGHESLDYRRYLYDQFESNIEVSNSGFYRNYCVQIDLSFLCLNAIIKSEHIFDEQATNLTNRRIDDKIEKEVDLYNKQAEEVENFESSQHAFSKLKSIVAQWIDDLKHGNMFAEILLEHLYRCISSPQSKLYDPQLLQFVNFLMKKSFSDLIDKFQKRDAVIIFASYNKIIISTKKMSKVTAVNYTNFIYKSIENIEAFKQMRFSTKKVWKSFMFKDKFNYAGFDADDKDNKVACEWDLLNHLPLKLHKTFNLLVADFMKIVYDFNQDNKNKLITSDARDHTIQTLGISGHGGSKEDEDPYVGNNPAYTTMDQLDKIQELSEPDDIHFMKGQIRSYFTNKLFKVIDEIHLSKNNADHDYTDSLQNPHLYTDEE